MAKYTFRRPVQRFDVDGNSSGMFELEAEVWDGGLLIHMEPLNPKDRQIFRFDEVTMADLREACNMFFKPEEGEEN